MVKPYLDSETDVAESDRPFEFFINRFRLLQPCPKQDFVNFTGLPLSSIEPTISQAIEEGYLSESEFAWQVTEKGRLFLNDLLECFMESEF